MDLLGVAYEISTTCNHCQQPLPLNGVGESVLCDNCRTPFPTPQQTWQLLLSGTVRETLRWEPGQSWTANFFAERDFKVVHTRRQPGCAAPCEAQFTTEQIVQASQAGELTCSSCARTTRVRAAPPWMHALHPNIAFLVGETTTSEHGRPLLGEVHFNCYHCGAPLPLDGKSRKATCSYCHNAVVVPDDIWERIHPVQSVDRWFAVLRQPELPRAAGVPQSVASFIGFCPLPNREMVIAWIDTEDGIAGHRCRLALLDGQGQMRWRQEHLAFGEDAELHGAPGGKSVWLVNRDPNDAWLRELDPATGGVIRMLPSAEPGLSVERHYGFAVDPDGSFVIHRYWGNVLSLRRFSPDGLELPLWKGHSKSAISDPPPHWYDLPNRIGNLPEEAHFCIGADGAIWILHPRPDNSSGLDTRYVARYRRDGVLEHLWILPDGLIERIQGIAGAADGSLYLVFEPADRAYRYQHQLARLTADRLEIVAGSMVSDDRALGLTYEVSLTRDGLTYLWGHRNDMNIFGFAADWSLVFATPAASERIRSWRAEAASSPSVRRVDGDDPSGGGDRPAPQIVWDVRAAREGAERSRRITAYVMALILAAPFLIAGAFALAIAYEIIFVW